jgi:hypothetical protein
MTVGELQKIVGGINAGPTRFGISHIYKSCVVHKLSGGQVTADLASGVRRGGGDFGVQTPPKFRIFDKVEPDCKLSGKCLVFLFQHPN